MKIVEMIKQLPFFSKNGNGKKWSKSALSFDLFYQLSYMSTIAASGVPRDQIFERSAEIQCSSAEYFRKIKLARDRLKFDYARACRFVGEPAKEEDIKGLLLRLSSSLTSGEPESDFLSREASARAADYESEYGRNLEAMKMWTDAYISLILSAILVVVIGIVSTMIWKIETALIIAMAFIAVSTTAVGVWLIWVVSPKEVIVLNRPGSKEQKIAAILFKPVLVVIISVFALFLITGMHLGWALIIIAAVAFPIGFIMSRDDKKISKRDTEIGTFLRSLGGVCSALETTVNSGLSRIDLNAINILRSPVKNLHTRLTAGIKPKLSWRMFIDETGSELTNRSVGMFYDAIEVGGSAGQAGQQAAMFANKLSSLRAHRKTVSSPFRWLCIAMHAAIIVILVFITEVISTFGGMVTAAQESIPNLANTPSISSFSSFNVSGLELLQHLVLPLVVVFTIANAIVPTMAEGGSKYKIFNNLGITAAISGIALLVLPALADQLFASVASL